MSPSALLFTSVRYEFGVINGFIQKQEQMPTTDIRFFDISPFLINFPGVSVGGSAYPGLCVLHQRIMPTRKYDVQVAVYHPYLPPARNNTVPICTDSCNRSRFANATDTCQTFWTI